MVEGIRKFVEIDEVHQCVVVETFSAASVGSPLPVQIDERLIRRIGVREWGLPSMCVPGQIWRSEKNGTITCMVASKDPARVKIETLPLLQVAAGESMSVMPDHWRAALWEYVQKWPHSGMRYGPLLAITEQQRCDFIRKMAAELVNSDNIGCCSIADGIGEFAAYDYELQVNELSVCGP